MKISMPNEGAFFGNLKNYIKAQEQKVAIAREQVAEFLVEELLKNIPVWSGSTAEGVIVSNSGTVAGEVGGDWRNAALYGETNKMAMGAEPMRAGAEAKARATVAGTNYDVASRVSVTVNSRAWGLVNYGKAPGGPGQSARNKAVVGQLALAATRARFKFVK